MSVQHRTAEVGDRGHARRRLTFSTPLSVSLVVVVAITVVAGAILLGPRGLFGPGIASSPTPMPIVQPTPTLGPTPTPTLEPTPMPTVEPTPTLEPTPPPVPVWTGLEWSDPLVLSDPPRVRVTDSLWWHGRYIGTGVVDRADPLARGALRVPLFLESPDGINWDVVQEMEEYLDTQGDTDAHPVRVVSAGDGLVALSGYILGGDRVIWRSADGRSWTETDSRVHGRAIAGGPAGVVVIGAKGFGCCMNPDGPAIIGHSGDGLSWTWLSDAPVFAHASFTDVEATSDGFLLVGWTGETEAEGRERGAADPHGRPAAWFSPDGLSWIAAPVEGSDDAEGGLSKVLVGADGVLAIGGLNRHPTAWISPDGLSWSRTELDAGMLVETLSVSDGTRMVILGREDVTTTDLAAWASPDGVAWTRLPFAGSPAPSWDRYVGADGSWSSGDALVILSEARLQRDGLVVHGSAADTSDPQGSWTPVSWVATAMER